MKLDQKIIVMTGGSSGIGLELLRRLGSNNTVINLSRSAPPEGLVANLRYFTQIETDLSDAASVASAIAQCRQRYSQGIDGLINCAAVQFTPRFTDSQFAASTIATEIAINLTSPIEIIAGLLEALRRRPEAFILNVNSGLGLVPKRESAVYCATKAGLDNFSRGLRAQLEGTQVSVLQAFLPLVDTPMTEGRGTGKLSAQSVADSIIGGIEKGVADNDIGKVKLLRAINRLSPSLANRIMQKGDA
ncbi:MAG: SDR family NAD(P)-dependent oxidoreductase [Erythrobacter sp.]|uniref:SDR family NAD(P)-dependent oxidoreductase n=1 Tax=Erythrobacter sp. TaxID=1042 RepID=UPI002614D95E|nr:SDR family NAD(P)-dependent oxidoreductase [Erythrobacter sp.]MDJ0977325.1 SDR family NAD(P)-dependent oxidoreductase [Erythrobacter sp.]